MGKITRSAALGVSLCTMALALSACTTAPTSGSSSDRSWVLPSIITNISTGDRTRTEVEQTTESSSNVEVEIEESARPANNGSRGPSARQQRSSSSNEDEDHEGSCETIDATEFYGSGRPALIDLCEKLESYRERALNRRGAYNFLANSTIPASGLAVYLALTGQTDGNGIAALTTAVATAWALGQYYEDDEASSTLWRGYSAMACVAYRSSPYLMTQDDARLIVAHADGSGMVAAYGFEPLPRDDDPVTRRDRNHLVGLSRARQNAQRALANYRIDTAARATDPEVVALVQEAEAAIELTDQLLENTQDLLFLAGNSGALIEFNTRRIDAELERRIDENRRNVGAIISLASDLDGVAGRLRSTLPIASREAPAPQTNGQSTELDSTDPSDKTEKELLIEALGSLSNAFSGLHARVTPRLRAASRLGAPSTCSLDDGAPRAPSGQITITPPDTVITMSRGESRQIAIAGGTRPYQVSVTPESEAFGVTRSGFDQPPVISLTVSETADAGSRLVTISDATGRRQLAIRVTINVPPPPAPAPAPSGNNPPAGYAEGPSTVVAQVAAYTQENRLDPDGVWGPKTETAVRSVLNIAADTPLATLSENQRNALNRGADAQASGVWAGADTNNVPPGTTPPRVPCNIVGARSVYECVTMQPAQLEQFLSDWAPGSDELMGPAAKETIDGHSDWGNVSEQSIRSAVDVAILSRCSEQTSTAGGITAACIAAIEGSGGQEDQ